VGFKIKPAVLLYIHGSMPIFLSFPVLLKKLNCFSITMESCFTSLMGCSLICVQTGQLLKESDKESGHQKTISSLSKSLDWSHFITGSLDKSAKVRICSSFDCRKDTYGFPDIQFSMHSYGIQERWPWSRHMSQRDLLMLLTSLPLMILYVPLHKLVYIYTCSFRLFLMPRLLT
jgi:hypothetical protein